MRIFFDTPAGRQLIEMSEQDYAKLPRGTRAQAEVTDLNTGKRYVLRRAFCGVAQSLCALELVREIPSLPSPEMAAASDTVTAKAPVPGNNMLWATIVDALAKTYATTPSTVESDLQESQADLDLASLCNTLASVGY